MLLRSLHVALAACFLGCLVLVYYCGIAARSHPLLPLAAAVLVVEFAVLTLNGGRCPWSQLQARFGDDHGLFSLFLPERWLPYVIPFFALVTGVGLLSLVRVY